MSVTEQQQTPPSTAEGATAEAADQTMPSDRPSAAPVLAEGDLTFAEMFEMAEKQAKERKKAQKATPRGDKSGPGAGAESEGGLVPGRVIQATVVGFSHDSVLLDVGAKAEGVISKAELLDDEGNLSVKEGEKVEVRVLTIDGDTIKLGKVLAHQSAKNREAVKQAYDMGLPVEGRISGVNKGGLDVSISGMRAFCPASQIDLRHVADPNAFLGQKLAFRITEYKDNGRNIVVSRRAILVEEAKKSSAETLSKLSVGQVLIGKVTTLKDYGAFIDLGGGVEGLVHVSEVSHGRVTKPGDALKIGQELSVRILAIEDRKVDETKKPRKGGDDLGSGKKISLTIKGLEEDPWTRAAGSLKEGTKVTGKVARIQPFGAFVEIFPGVDGLIHVSAMSTDRIRDPRQVLKEGDEIEATVVSLDLDKKRIGLSMVKTPQELAAELGKGAVFDGIVDRIETFGLFVKLPTGARGLVPSAETGTQRGVDLKKEFQPGQTVKVTVLEVDNNNGKIRLSIKAAAEAEERAEFSSFIGANKQVGGFGTLADKLKGALKKK
jgi:small subunit ribosomal protein S1